MFKHIYILLILSGVACPRYFFAQNLVLNPSFEYYHGLPDNIGQIDSIQNWSNPIGNSPDYFHELSSNSLVQVPSNFAGFQFALNGRAYSHIVLQQYLSSGARREYVQGELAYMLSKDSTYCVEIYISVTDGSDFGVDAIGLKFSSSELSDSNNDSLLHLVPDITNPMGEVISDTSNWTVISGYHIARGDETHFSIGNFMDEQSISIAPDTLKGVFNTFCAIYIDSVSVIKCTLPPNPPDTSSSTNFLNVFPNPNSGEFTISYGVVENKRGRFSVWDDVGRLIYRSAELTGKFENEIHLTQVSAGLYLWRFDVDGNKEVTGKLIITQ